jgi:MFS family permease
MSGVAKRPIAYGRVLATGGGILVSGVLTYFFSDRLENTADVMAIIATIFSILAAALIAIVSILGDPSMLIDHSWRYNSLLADEVQRKLHRKSDIFILYIIILGLLFAFVLTDKCSLVYPWMQRAVFFFSTLGFLASLSLPHSLKEIQRKRLQDAIAAKKAATPSP